MSHNKERKEKICLNCRAVVYGRYCHVCGQENIETRESFGHLVFHFIADIFHFDGKFFSTLKYLLLRPGYLTYEYVRGRRASYIHPIKLYVFTSAVFFILYFSLFNGGDENTLIKFDKKPTIVYNNDSAALVKSNEKTPLFLKKLEDPDIQAKVWDKVNHSIPQILFLSLPIAAFLLYLLYIRWRKQTFYAAHGIFILHAYTAVFILIACKIAFERLNDILQWQQLNWLSTAFILGIFFYFYKAMQNFYDQGFFKTLIKFLIFFIAIFIIIMLLFTGYLLAFTYTVK